MVLDGLSDSTFQSTLPVWGATAPIQIKANPATYFNPRSPCGERLGQMANQILPLIFQSTLPVWGATYGGIYTGQTVSISIHAPRVGSDSKYAQKYTCEFVT